MQSWCYTARSVNRCQLWDQLWNSESVQIPYTIINYSLWAKLTCFPYTQHKVFQVFGILNSPLGPMHLWDWTSLSTVPGWSWEPRPTGNVHMPTHCFAISKYDLVRERACHFSNEPRNPLGSINKVSRQNSITNLKTPYFPFGLHFILIVHFRHSTDYK